MITVTSPTVTLSPDLVPAVLAVVKQQDAAKKKAADAKAEALAKAEAEVARLKAEVKGN